MAVLISCQNLAKSYHARPLFDGLTLGIEEGERLGIVGPNGAGKSTLLKIFAGLEEADDGTLVRRSQTRIAYVPQSHDYPGTRTCAAIVADAARRTGVDDPETRASILLGQLGFGDAAAATTSQLSGGWLKRLAIAEALVTTPDLLLLDEPTNHLDIEGIAWLSQLLSAAKFAWVMISHDRWFLEKTVNRVAELNRTYPGGIYVATGTYSNFLAARQDFLQQQAKIEETLANKVRREVEWLRRGPQARTTKAQARIDEAHALIEELATVRGRNKTSSTGIDFAASGRKTKRLLVVDQVSKVLEGRTIIRGLDLVLTPGMRLGLVGANGTGKSTILKMLAGQWLPDSGQIVRAENLKVVYFDQSRARLDPDKTLKDTLCPYGDSVIFRERSVHVATWARRFQFQASQLTVPVGQLSGGEQARALIAQLMLQEADVLLLDEPTNDLDIPTLETLEESLTDFPGALVLVTHDRFMLEQVTNLILGLDGNGGARIYASCDQWESEMRALSRSIREKPLTADEPRTEPARSRPSSSKRLSYMEQREYDQMEAAILEAETFLEACRKTAEDPALATQSVKLQDAYKTLQDAQQKVERLYARWAELEAKVSSADQR